MERGTAAPTFRTVSIGAKRLYGSRCHLVYGGRPRPRWHCVRRGPSSPPHGKGHNSPHISARVYCGQRAGSCIRILGCHLVRSKLSGQSTLISRISWSLVPESSDTMRRHASVIHWCTCFLMYIISGNIIIFVAFIPMLFIGQKHFECRGASMCSIRAGFL